jgi:hypothetical protein
MAEVVATDEFAAWYDGLDDGHTACVFRAVTQLEVAGVSLGFPLSSAIKGSAVALRELRVKCQGHQLRVFYIFDETRNAVLLVGGDKTGDDRFYERMIPLSEAIWSEYQAEQKGK